MKTKRTQAKKPNKSNVPKQKEPAINLTIADAIVAFLNYEKAKSYTSDMLKGKKASLATMYLLELGIHKRVLYSLNEKRFKLHD